MSTAAPKPPAAQTRPHLPPPETFWKKYSARHEFPLSTAFSIFVHVVAVGLILLVGYLAQLGWYRPENKPVENDVVTLAGDSSTAGGSGPGGAPGDGLPPAPFSVPVPGMLEKIYEQPFSTEPQSADDAGPEINPDALSVDAKEAGPDDAIIEMLKKAGKAIPDPPKAAPPLMTRLPGVKAKGGVGGVKGGAFGSGGKGFGSGKGDGYGPGSGPGKFGRTLTRQEFLAQRWNFDLSGPPKVHLDKLTRVGFIVGLEAADGRFYTIVDIKRRPAEIKRDNFEKYKEAVKWHNTNADSVRGVLKEMGINEPIQRIFLFLPKDRENQLVQEEVRYAKSIGRPLNSFDYIWFDFQLSDGRYEPTALRVGNFPGKG